MLVTDLMAKKLISFSFKFLALVMDSKVTWSATVDADRMRLTNWLLGG